MDKTHHPKCGKTYPVNNTHGHCGACCETFYGLSAFDEHRTGPHTDRRCEIQPYESIRDEGTIRYGHWQDHRGYWHHGKRLTEAEKREIFGDRI